MEKINQSKNHIVGSNIKRLRTEKKLRNIDIVTQLQLSGIDITTSTLSKIENGYSNPPVNMLIELTNILDCDYNAFFQQ